MNSKESLGIVGVNYAYLSTKALEIAIQRGVEIGTKTALDFIAQEKKVLRKGRYDKRLRNTRLLLRNYRSLKTHARDAVFSATQAKENAVDILDGLNDYSFDDDLYVESIKKSRQRTLIILRHIEEMLRYYRINCEQSGKAEELRRYRVIMATYINDEKKSAEEIATDENIERRTIYKDINMAIKTLSALIFGIDSLKVY